MGEVRFGGLAGAPNKSGIGADIVDPNKSGIADGLPADVAPLNRSGIGPRLAPDPNKSGACWEDAPR